LTRNQEKEKEKEKVKRGKGNLKIKRFLMPMLQGSLKYTSKKVYHRANHPIKYNSS